ncbi:hypothetical protein [Halorubellus litoreus]|uniref:Uncharacterized protein n=1 Tax=Halorubellus litoreus TaxID=755308 RepID=A0ABD5VLP9_9EURY
MTTYSSSLKTWGAQGSEYPTGYDYLAGDQPVDAYDNNFNYNVVEDILHLVSVTNERLDSSRAASNPSSPTNGQQVFRTDTSRLGYYNGSVWKTVAEKGEVDAVQTALDNHEADSSNPHSVTPAQIGAAPVSHVTNTGNPHDVTASQVGAVKKSGDSVTGTLDLSGGRVVLPLGTDKWA